MQGKRHCRARSSRMASAWGGGGALHDLLRHFERIPRHQSRRFELPPPPQRLEVVLPTHRQWSGDHSRRGCGAHHGSELSGSRTLQRAPCNASSRTRKRARLATSSTSATRSLVGRCRHLHLQFHRWCRARTVVAPPALLFLRIMVASAQLGAFLAEMGHSQLRWARLGCGDMSVHVGAASALKRYLSRATRDALVLSSTTTAPWANNFPACFSALGKDGSQLVNPGHRALLCQCDCGAFATASSTRRSMASLRSCLPPTPWTRSTACCLASCASCFVASTSSSSSSKLTGAPSLLRNGQCDGAIGYPYLSRDIGAEAAMGAATCTCC